MHLKKETGLDFIQNFIWYQFKRKKTDTKKIVTECYVNKLHFNEF